MATSFCTAIRLKGASLKKARLLCQFRRSACDVRILHDLWAQQRPDMVFSRIVEDGFCGSILVVLGDGSASRDLYMGDALDAIIRAMEKGEPHEVFNMGSSELWM